MGLNQDGSFYLLALTRDNIRIAEGVSPDNPNAAAELAEKAKKSKLNVFTTPETFAVKTEETLLKWVDSQTQEADAFPLLQQANGILTSAEVKNHAKKNRKANPAQKPELPQENGG